MNDPAETLRKEQARKDLADGVSAPGPTTKKQAGMEALRGALKVFDDMGG